MNNDPIVIVSMARTPMGGFGGDFNTVAAPDLGAAAIKAAVERSGIDSVDVEEVYMGCVLPAGLGQAPSGAELMPTDLVGSFDPAKVSSTPTVLPDA